MQSFLSGLDSAHFDYSTVDDDEELDGEEGRRDLEDAYFDQEEEDDQGKDEIRSEVYDY